MLEIIKKQFKIKSFLLPHFLNCRILSIKMNCEDEEDSYPEEEKWADALEPGPDGSVTAQINDESFAPGHSGTSGHLQGGQAKGHISRMELNTNKAGMDGLDKEKINKIIMEASLGSRYYENEQKKDLQVNERIRKILAAKTKLMNNELAAAQLKVDKMVKELERTRDLSRTIVHIDMDMFYAAVEMLEKPELREKPMAVGGTHMLSTSNYVARRFGVRAGMPGFIALKLCPNLVMVRPNFDKYRKYSQQVREILEEYDPNFCPMSLDEAYLDFTDHLVKRRTMSEKERTHVECIRNNPEETGEKNKNKGEAGSEKSGDEAGCSSSSMQADHSVEKSDAGWEEEEKLLESSSERGERTEQGDNAFEGKPQLFGISVEEAVREMRFRIQQKTNLTASAGIAPNCMLAKIASDMNKPNGQYVIKSTREEVMKFISNLPVRKVSGIGKVMEKILSAVGVKSCTELYENRAMLYKLFAPISFNHFLKISLGLGSTYVGRDGERKSVSTERTFGEKSKPEDLFRICEELCESLAQDVEKHGLKGRTLTLKFKTVTFEVKNRSQSFQNGICTFKDMHSAARDLLQTEIRACRPHPLQLRLMGVRLSSFLSEEEIHQQQKQGSLMSFLKKSQLKSRNSAQKNDIESNKGIEEDEHCQKPENLINEDSHLEQKSENISSDISSKDVEENSVLLPREQTDEEAVENYSSESFTCDDTIEVPESPDDTDETEVDNFSENQRYLCPVCNIEKLYNSLEEFNQHVDICLNKGEISTILHKQAKGDQTSNVLQARSMAPKKRPSTSSSRSNKRMKTGRKRQYSTLDKFFAKNS